jgi:hypothetical protein
MRDFNLVVTTESPAAEMMWERLTEWTKAGLIRRLYHTTDVGEKVTEITASVSEGPPEQLFDHLAKRPYDTVRIAIVQLVGTPDADNAALLAWARSVADTVRQGAPAGATVHVFNILMPADFAVLGTAEDLLLDNADANLVVSPVDRPLPSYFARPVDDHEIYASHAAHAVTQALGLWSGSGAGPFDDSRPVPIDGAPSVIAFRGFTRLLAGDYVADRLVHETLPIGGRHAWPLTDIQHQFEPDDPVAEVDRVADEFSAGHQRDLAARPAPVIPEPVPMQEIGIGGALGMLLGRVARLPNDLIVDVQAGSATAIERVAQSVLFGADSRYHVTIGERATSLPPPGEPIALTDIDALVDELGGGTQRTGIAEAESTFGDLRDLLLGLVDGAKTKQPLRTDGGKRMAVTDPGALIPAPSAAGPEPLASRSKKEWNEVISHLAEREPGPPERTPVCDPRDLTMARARIGDSAEAAREKSDQQETKKSKKERKDEPETKKSKKEQKTEAREIARLDRARRQLTQISEFHSQTFVGRIGTRLGAALDVAADSLLEALTRVRRTSNPDSALAEDLGRLRTQRWVLFAFFALSLLTFPLWPWMRSLIDDVSRAYAVVFPVFVVIFIVLLVRYAMSVFRFENRRRRPHWMHEQANSDVVHYVNEVRRLRTVYGRFVGYAEVLAWDIHDPWRGLSYEPQESARIGDLGLPLAVQAAEAEVDRPGMYVALHKAQEDVYRVGWMTSVSNAGFAEYAARYLGGRNRSVEDLEGGPTAANLDPSSPSVWSRYLEHERSGDVGRGAANEAEEAVLAACREADLESMFILDLSPASAEAQGVDEPDDFLRRLVPTADDAPLARDLFTARVKVTGRLPEVETTLIGPARLWEGVGEHTVTESYPLLERGKPYLNIAARVDATEPTPSDFYALFETATPSPAKGEAETLGSDDF